MWIWIVAQAMAGSTPDVAALAESEGLPAAHDAFMDMVNSAKNEKKLEKALLASRYTEVSLPSKAALGAELVITELSAVTGCTWNGQLVCPLTGTTQAKLEAGEMVAQCKSKYGAKRDIEVTLDAATETTAQWTLTGVEQCWGLNQPTLTVVPVALADLEGIGTGDDDLIPPELTGLTWQQVEKTLLDAGPLFKSCYRDKDGSKATGKLVVAFHIAEDGRIDRAEAEESSLDNPEVEACILEKFQRVNFPPPMDGFTDGTFPFTLQ